MAFLGLSYVAGKVTEKVCNHFDVDPETTNKLKWAARLTTMVVMLDPTEAIGGLLTDAGTEAAAEAATESMDQLDAEAGVDDGNNNHEQPATAEKKSGLKFGGSSHTCWSCGGSGAMWANTGRFNYTCTSCGGSGTW